MRAPAALVAIPLCAGSVVGFLHAGAADPALPIAAAAGACLALLAATIGHLEDLKPDAALAVALGAFLAGVSMGVSETRSAYSTPLVRWYDGCASADRGAPTVLEGTLIEDAAPTAYGAVVTLAVDTVGSSACGGHSALRGGVRLAVGGEGTGRGLGEWRAGRRLRVTALLRRPVAYRDPGVADDLGVLARRGISLVGSIKSAALVDVIGAGGAVAEAAAAARGWIRAMLARFVGCWSERSRALSAAILIGDRSGLSAEDERRLQDAGTYHVLAISGGNIAILAALLLWLLRWVRLPSRAAAATTIVVLVFYGELTGFPPSVGRAVSAAVIYLAGRLIDQRGPAANALAVAAIGALAVSPLAAVDPGFVLSFGATLGILLGAPPLLAALPARLHQPPAGRRALRRIVQAAAAAVAALVVATLAAEIALAPLAAAIFSRVTAAGLILNVAAIPLMTIEQVASTALLFAAPIVPEAARACGYVADRSASALVASARLIDVMPWLARDVPAPSWWLIVLYYGCTIAALRWRRWRRVAVSGMAAAAATGLWSPAWATRDAVPPPPSGWLRVVFLDVGQGDATLVVLPDGRALLVDAAGLPGSSFDIGERVVAPTLRAFGIRALDTLVLTHGDPDHIGGALAVLRHFPVRVVWEGIPVPRHEGLGAVRSAAAGAWQRLVQAGDVDRHGPIEVRVLHPAPPAWERQRVRNDDSIVVELRLGEVSIVLPGDIGVEGERAVIPRLAPGSLVVLKAPHHGSATSSTPEFLAALRPAAVIFSAGAANHFGHPAPPVVDRYRRFGAAMFRTDRDGAIVVETDGAFVQIETRDGRRTVFAAAHHETHEASKRTK